MGWPCEAGGIDNSVVFASSIPDITIVGFDVAHFDLFGIIIDDPFFAIFFKDKLFTFLQFTINHPRATAMDAFAHDSDLGGHVLKVGYLDKGNRSISFKT